MSYGSPRIFLETTASCLVVSPFEFQHRLIDLCNHAGTELVCGVVSCCLLPQLRVMSSDLKLHDFSSVCLSLLSIKRTSNVDLESYLLELSVASYVCFFFYIFR